MRDLRHNREAPRQSLRQRVAHIAAPLTVAGGMLMLQVATLLMGDTDSPRKIRSRSKNRSGITSETPSDPEPAGLVYDDRPPCVIKRRRPGPPQSVSGPDSLPVVRSGAQFRLQTSVRSVDYPYLYPAGTLVTLVNPKNDHLWVAQTTYPPTGELDWVDVGLEALGAFEGESESYCIPKRDLEPLKKTEVEFAEGANRPQWPLATDEDRKLRVSYQDVTEKWHGSWGREFGASRQGEKGARVHVGVDLFADEGDLVVTTEPGEILATLTYHSGTHAVYVKHDSGIIVNYGEVRPSSWKKFGIDTGVDTGQRVNAGQPIAEVGLACKASNRDASGKPIDKKKCSHMLHIETFEGDVTSGQIRREEMQWRVGKPAPTGLLDPTRYLVRAQKNKYDQLLEAEG